MLVRWKDWATIGAVLALVFLVAIPLAMYATKSDSPSEKFRRTVCPVASCDAREKVRVDCDQHPNTEVVELDRGRDFPKSRFVCDEP